VKAIQKEAESVKLTWLNKSDSTKKNVLKGMAESSWIHLACHAMQDLADPTRSALKLHGSEELELQAIMQKSYGHGGLAFLSACQTATGDEKVPEEAVHLAAGMLAAGYSSVIATMWSIRDEDAPLVAREVYSRLFGKYMRDGVPDPRKAAYALHESMAVLREEIGEEKFDSWVPFIHMGQ
jgi:CHAT domain-containing protein